MHEALGQDYHIYDSHEAISWRALVSQPGKFFFAEGFRTGHCLQGKSWAIRWLQHFAAVYVLQFNQTQKLLCKDLGLCRPGQSGISSLINVHKVLCNKICNTFSYQEMMNKVYMDMWWVGWEVLYLLLKPQFWTEQGVSSCVATIVLFYQWLCFSQKANNTEKSWEVIHSGQTQITCYFLLPLF